MLEFKFSGLEEFIEDLIDELDEAIPEALTNAMTYFKIVVDPNVPVDTGALRDSFTTELLTPYEIYGTWSVEDPRTGFPYGTFQYYNHKSKSDWINVTIDSYSGNMAKVFENTLMRRLSR